MKSFHWISWWTFTLFSVFLSGASIAYAGEEGPGFEVSTFGGVATSGSEGDYLGWETGLFPGLPVGDNFTLGG